MDHLIMYLLEDCTSVYHVYNLLNWSFYRVAKNVPTETQGTRLKNSKTLTEIAAALLIACLLTNSD